MSTRRWLYQVVEIKPKWWGGLDAEEVQAELTRQGTLGWELVSVIVPQSMTATQLIMKKEG